MLKKIALIPALCALCAGPLAAQGAPEEPDPDAELLAEIAYIAQELGVPVPLPGGPVYERPADYPPAAWAAGEEGKSWIAVSVDAAGKPTHCAVYESSGSEALDERTCELVMERGAFQPALDPEGQPFAGEYRGFHTWRRRLPQNPASYSVTVSYTVTPQGDVADCKVDEAEGELRPRQRTRIENNPCPQASWIEGHVYRDENGVPVSKRVTISSSVVISDPE